ncbi:hypothetical protein Nhal_2099 [Nitrosococcus halophilus Nc 4]|uniref:Cytochrome c n=1 Tax=Nitrosococcus halophilus (strain Nc4) TaxID=472759 RepID=D5C4L6_NITHN|nr:cytochrome c [Nitrosococcus halophilus]ADE15200.1 hypothetical protein Nhal_2099 [Nitrosococcus halophilus Nc 4]
MNKFTLTSSRIFAIAMLSVVATHPLNAADPEEESKVKEFMQVKLSSSHDVLEGLVEEDFYKILGEAKRMLAMSHASEWYVMKTPKYKEYSTEFRDHLQELIGAAKDKNLDIAARSYSQLTVTCAKCHKHVREEQ